MKNDKYPFCRVLVAPAHYMLDNISGGSEYKWPYKIIEALGNTQHLYIDVICGFLKSRTPLTKNIEIFELKSEKKLKLTYFYRLKFVFQYFSLARSLIKQRSYDIIHHMLPFGFDTTFNLLPLLGYCRKKRFVIGPLQAPHTYVSNEELVFSEGNFQGLRGWQWVHDTIGLKLLKYLGSLFQYLSRKGIEKADVLIVVNERAKQLYSRIKDSKDIVIIPPGIDTFKFNNEIHPCGEKARIELLTVGWLIKRKNLETLIRIVGDLSLRFPLRLRIVGDGPQRARLEDLVNDCGLADCILFEGFVPNEKIHEYYFTSHISCSTSLSESFGYVCLEAMASGLAVVAFKTGSFEDMVKDYHTGFLIDSGDEEGFRERLRELLTDRNLLNRIRHNARQHVLAHYDWNIIAKKYNEVYSSLLKVETKEIAV